MSVEDVRAATLNDVPALLTLIEEYWRFEQIAGFDRARLEPVVTRALADHRLGRAWVALVDGHPAGYLFVVFVYSLEYQGLTAEIDELFMQRGYRGRALGERLLDAAETACVAAGCTKMFLQLGRGNDAARRFYRRRGFSQRHGYDLLDKDLA